MTKLYFSPGACSLASHIALIECGLPFTTEKVDMKTKTTTTGKNFNEINPKSQVPTIETKDGKVLTEGVAILQYISDQAPEKEFLPRPGTWERTQAIEGLSSVSELHETMGFFFSVDRLITNKEGNAEIRKNWTEGLSKKFDFFSNQLKNQPFLLGNKFTAVDAYAFAVLSWHNMLKIDLTKWPTIMGYMEKVKMQPSVQKAMKTEGLI